MSIGNILNLLFYFVVGGYFTLMGFGFVRACKTDEEERIWREKYAKVLKVCGPVLLFAGVVTLAIVVI